jgi:hypothetical protein
LTGTCGRCGAVLRSADEQVELRAEYRSVKTLRRLRTWRVRLLCRGCAMSDWLDHDRPADATQEALFATTTINNRRNTQ